MAKLIVPAPSDRSSITPIFRPLMALSLIDRQCFVPPSIGASCDSSRVSKIRHSVIGWTSYARSIEREYAVLNPRADSQDIEVTEIPQHLASYFSCRLAGKAYSEHREIRTVAVDKLCDFFRQKPVA